MKLVVIDYGMGNLHSVGKAVEHVAPADCQVRVSDDPAIIASADRVLLPGQGAARDCMAAIDNHGLREPIMHAIASKPFLGICMGLQVLLDHSAENGGIDCLGHFAGNVSAFALDLVDPANGDSLCVPAMGWNPVFHSKHALWEGIDQGQHFYYAHSYYVVPDDPQLVVGESEYPERFACALARDNVFACQFHPEKSASQGLRLLQNFVQWTV